MPATLRVGDKQSRDFAMIELRRIAFDMRDQMEQSTTVADCVALANEFIAHFCLEDVRKP